MQKPKHHIFICCSFRVAGEAQGGCAKKGARDLVQYIESELSDRGMDDVMVSTSGCLKLCDKAPVLVVYPEGHWYGGVNEEAADAILDALAAGGSADTYRID